MAARLVGMAAMATAVCALIFVPHARHGGGIAAADVRAALHRANTWHLVGWKLQNGRQAPWEVWGRRQPFLYREQLGEGWTVDDGERRVRLLPADPEKGRQTAVAILTPSRPGPENTGWDFLSAIDRWAGGGSPIRETGAVATFVLNTVDLMSNPPLRRRVLLTIDKRTLLPTRFQVSIREGASQRVRPDGSPRPEYLDRAEEGLRTNVREWISESLDAQYDVSVPDSVAAPQLPPGCRVIDAVSGPGAAVPGVPVVATPGGLYVQTKALAMDAAGNVVVRVRAGLGNLPGVNDVGVPVRTELPRRMRDDGPSGGVPRLDERYPARIVDDRGRPYVPVEVLQFHSFTQDLMLFAPQEPLAQGAPLPRTLTFPMTVSAITSDWIGDAKDAWIHTPLMSEDVTCSAALPSTIRAIDAIALATANLQYGTVNADHGHEPPMETRIARARAERYFELGQAATNVPQGAQFGPTEAQWRGRIASRRALFLRSAYWDQRAAALYPPHSDESRGLRISGAVAYGMANDTGRERAILRDIIAECKRRPGKTGRILHMAEENLRLLDAQEARQRRAPGGLGRSGSTRP